MSEHAPTIKTWKKLLRTVLTWWSSWSNADTIYTQRAKLLIFNYLFGQFLYLTYTNVVFELHLQICNHTPWTIRRNQKAKRVNERER